MNTEEICALNVKEITENDCILFIWGTWPRLPDVLEVIKAWGFKYKTNAFVWIKQNRNRKPCLGMGYWTRSNTEFCLLATRGKVKRISANVFQLVFSRRRKHSEKPKEVREKIVELVGDLPRIELFARQRFEGWDVWGLEVPEGQRSLQ